MARDCFRGVVLALLVGFGYQQVLESQRSLPKPFSIWYQTRLVDENGAVTAEGPSFVGGRTNGDTVESFPGWPTKSINRHSKGIVVGVNTARAMVSTRGDGKPMHPALHTFGDQCERYDDLTGESKTILGFKVLRLYQVVHEPGVTRSTEA